MICYSSVIIILFIKHTTEASFLHFFKEQFKSLLTNKNLTAAAAASRRQPYQDAQKQDDGRPSYDYGRGRGAYRPDYGRGREPYGRTPDFQRERDGYGQSPSLKQEGDSYEPPSDVERGRSSYTYPYGRDPYEQPPDYHDDGGYGRLSPYGGVMDTHGEKPSIYGRRFYGQQQDRRDPYERGRKSFGRDRGRRKSSSRGRYGQESGEGLYGYQNEMSIERRAPVGKLNHEDYEREREKTLAYLSSMRAYVFDDYVEEEVTTFNPRPLIYPTRYPRVYINKTLDSSILNQFRTRLTATNIPNVHKHRVEVHPYRATIYPVLKKVYFGRFSPDNVEPMGNYSDRPKPTGNPTNGTGYRNFPFGFRDQSNLYRQFPNLFPNQTDTGYLGFTSIYTQQKTGRLLPTRGNTSNTINVKHRSVQIDYSKFPNLFPDREGTGKYSAIKVEETKTSRLLPKRPDYGAQPDGGQNRVFQSSLYKGQSGSERNENDYEEYSEDEQSGNYKERGRVVDDEGYRENEIEDSRSDARQTEPGNYADKKDTEKKHISGLDDINYFNADDYALSDEGSEYREGYRRNRKGDDEYDEDYDDEDSDYDSEDKSNAGEFVYQPDFDKDEYSTNQTKEEIFYLTLNATILSKEKLVEYLQNDGYILSDEIAAAMLQVDRVSYNPFNLKDELPEDSSLSIWSDMDPPPYMQAVALEILKDHLKVGHRALDVGYGSGYLTSLMAQMVKGKGGYAVGVDYSRELIRMANYSVLKDNYLLLQQGHVKFVAGDVSLGAPSFGPFDAIHVALSGPEVPEHLFQQLKVGGRLLAPPKFVGEHTEMYIYDKVTERNITFTKIFGRFCSRRYFFDRRGLLSLDL